MEIFDCSCKGINPSCEKCFGRGYFDLTTLHNYKRFENFPIEKRQEKPQEKPIEKVETFIEKISKLNAVEIGLLAKKLIDIIDLQSEKQSEIFLALFKTKYNRFPSKIEKLKRKKQYDMIYNIENEKEIVKGKLRKAIKQGIIINKLIQPRFINPLSNMKVDTTSKSQLKIIKKFIRQRL